MNILTFVFGILLIGIPLAEALNITIDNTSPLVVFSPTPCFQADTPGCSPEWQLSEATDAFNGSTTTTTGPDAALGLTVVPRVSLVFQGTSVVFVPGQHSTAQATVVVDNLASILVNTSLNAFTGTGLDPASNHTITVTFVPGNGLTSLDVDYFVIGLPETNITSSATSTFVPTPLPTSLPPTSTPPPTLTSSPVTGTQAALAAQASGTPQGTIAAVSSCGAVLVLFAALTWFFAARRRRRRTAYQREKAILYDLRLPSERNSKERNVAVRNWADEQREHPGRELESGPPEGQDTQRREKGKGRERTWRDSVLPPVHYTPWRSLAATPHVDPPE